MACVSRFSVAAGWQASPAAACLWAPFPFRATSYRIARMACVLLSVHLWTDLWLLLPCGCVDAPPRACGHRLLFAHLLSRGDTPIPQSGRSCCVQLFQRLFETKEDIDISLFCGGPVWGPGLTHLIPPFPGWHRHVSPFQNSRIGRSTGSRRAVQSGRPTPETVTLLCLPEEAPRAGPGWVCPGRTAGVSFLDLGCPPWPGTWGHSVPGMFPEGCRAPSERCTITISISLEMMSTSKNRRRWQKANIFK